jgi:SHS2 domain-containing protein
MGLVAYGKSLAEAFANAAYGLFSLIVEPNKVKEKESRKVMVQAQDAESLLFNWINELIYIFEVERLLFKSFDITDFTGQSLEATCGGEKYDPSRHQLKTGVKSATYHMLKVDGEKNRVQVIFDV